MLRAASLPWPMPTVTVLSPGTMSPPRTRRRAPSSSLHPLDDAVDDLEPRHAVEQREVTSWPSASTTESASRRLELAVGCGLPLASSFIFSTVIDELAGLLDRGQPLDQHALPATPPRVRLVRRHALARAPVDDDRFGRAEAFRGARDVERRVAAAVDDHAPPQQWLLFPSMPRSTETASEHLRGAAAGCRRAWRCARRRRGTPQSKRPRALRLEQVRHLRIELERDAEVDDALDLGVEHSRGSRYFGCRSASCRPAPGQPRESSRCGPAARGGMRRRVRTARRPRPARACRSPVAERRTSSRAARLRRRGSARSG